MLPTEGIADNVDRVMEKARLDLELGLSGSGRVPPPGLPEQQIHPPEQTAGMESEGCSQSSNVIPFTQRNQTKKRVGLR